MNNNKGVTLLALIIAILAMIVLASIFTLPSLDIISKGRNFQSGNEFNDVVSIVNSISSIVVIGSEEFSFDGFREATNEEIESFLASNNETAFTQEDVDLIIERNENAEENKKYYIFSGKELEKISLELEKAKNTYLINFYDGVVIAKINKDETKIAGIIVLEE